MKVRNIPFLVLCLGVFFQIGCSMQKKIKCYQQYFANSRFDYLSNKESYFTIKDTMQYEYAAGKLYSVSKLQWTTCSRYRLIILQTNYLGGLQIGDTLYVSITDKKSDTIFSTASAKSKSFDIAFVKKN